jgi:CBS domain containing-hemolysin-like protein
VGGDDAASLAVIVLLIAAAGIFAAAEIGFLALGRHRARRVAEGRLIEVVEALLARPAITLGTILVAITALNYSAEAIAASWTIRHGLPVWLAIVGLSLLVVLFAEAVPISYAAANPERVARATAAPLWLASLVLLVPARLVGFLADRLARLLGGHPVPEAPVTEGEIRAIVDLQAEAGSLEEEEKAMIHHIFEFGDKVAREVMVPRTDVVAIASSATVKQAAKLAAEHHISRLPVYGQSLDDIAGILYVKDVVPLLASGQADVLVSAAMKTPFRVPETRKLSDLVTDFRRQRRTLAIVLDEYGGTAGLVTLEDVLEEVVGDIYDEHDIVRPAIERLEEGSFGLDGRVSVEEASEVLGVSLPEGDYDSVAGLLYDRLGMVPKIGERVELDRVALIAEEVHGHRIRRVGAVLKPLGGPPGKPAPDEGSVGQ